MLQKGNHIIKKTWFKAAVQCFLAIALFLMASTGVARQGNRFSEITKPTVKESHTTPDSKPALPVPGIPEENEAEEETGTDGDGDFFSLITADQSRDASELLRLQSLKSLHNRQTVSLFILYHSWKSFLS